MGEKWEKYMGVHIRLERVKDVNEHDFREVSKEFNFDTLRHSGDEEFASSDLWEGITCCNHYCCDYLFNRPKDFEKTRKWIDNNIVPDGNKKRLLSLIDILKNNKDLYLYFSW